MTEPDDPRHNRVIRRLANHRVLRVDVGGGASMALPYTDWLWRLNWTEDETPKGICNDRQLVVGVLESYLYLVTKCSKDEAWRRIKLLRAALIASEERS